MEREGLFLAPWVYEVVDFPGIVGGLLLSEGIVGGLYSSNMLVFGLERPKYSKTEEYTTLVQGGMR